MSSSRLSLAWTPLMRLYEHITVQGRAVRTMWPNARRYSSCSVRSSIAALTRMRSVSWLLAAKCLSDAPTSTLCTPRTHASPNAADRNGSSE